MSSVFEYPKEYYTYADYLEWDEGIRAEIVDGELYMMGQPSTTHQRILRKILVKLDLFLEGKTCEVFPAPFGVRLFPEPDNEDGTVFQPDISVVCDPEKLDEWGCNGAPDFVIEILSPSNLQHDMIVKYRKYQQAGVREYWIVDPESRSIRVCLLENGHYTTIDYEEDLSVPVLVLPGCSIGLKEIFPDNQE